MGGRGGRGTLTVPRRAGPGGKGCVRGRRAGGGRGEGEWPSRAVFRAPAGIGPQWIRHVVFHPGRGRIDCHPLRGAGAATSSSGGPRQHARPAPPPSRRVPAQVHLARPDGVAGPGHAAGGPGPGAVHLQLAGPGFAAGPGIPGRRGRGQGRRGALPAPVEPGHRRGAPHRPGLRPERGRGGRAHRGHPGPRALRAGQGPRRGHRDKFARSAPQRPGHRPRRNLLQPGRAHPGHGRPAARPARGAAGDHVRGAGGHGGFAARLSAQAVGTSGPGGAAGGQGRLPGRAGGGARRAGGDRRALRGHERGRGPARGRAAPREPGIAPRRAEITIPSSRTPSRAFFQTTGGRAVPGARTPPWRAFLGYASPEAMPGQPRGRPDLARPPEDPLGPAGPVARPGPGCGLGGPDAAPRWLAPLGQPFGPAHPRRRGPRQPYRRLAGGHHPAQRRWRTNCAIRPCTIR